MIGNSNVNECLRFCPPQGRELLRETYLGNYRNSRLLSPAGARVVTLSGHEARIWLNKLLSPAGARVVTMGLESDVEIAEFLSPAGARFVMWKQPKYMKKTSHVAVPRRGVSCYKNRYFQWLYDKVLLSPAGARVVTIVG